jgi:hypothetical protein
MHDQLPQVIYDVEQAQAGNRVKHLEMSKQVIMNSIDRK